MNDVLIVIPAIKKNAVIPDQLIKKLDGITLIQRAINTILELNIDRKQVLILTDSDEISLIAKRNNITCKKDKLLSLNSENIVQETIDRTKEFSQKHMLLYRANTPLLGSDSIKLAYSKFLKLNNSLLISVKREIRNIYLIDDSKLKKIESQDLCDEIGAFYIFDKDSINERNLMLVPFIIPDEKSIEIKSYQSWWVCEKILQRRKIVFHVFGSIEIGMGHIYHSLSLAHNITDHEVMFVCDEKYELAVKKIASTDYKVIVSNNIERTIFDINPDMVINDVLNTTDIFILKLKEKEISVINFEDLGSGSKYADVVFNELYEVPQYEGNNYYWGHKYLTLRDEFDDTKPNTFRDNVEEVLVIFGGTDQNNLTLKTVKSIINICQVENIKINIICGIGYLFLDELKLYLSECEYKGIVLHYAISSVSEIMEKSQLAISSNGRTIYELAEMNIPSIIVSHHERESTHDFAKLEKGFVNFGVVNNDTFSDIKNIFNKLVYDNDYRNLLYTNISKYSFGKNKEKVLKLILSYLS
jgi:spore coat polysaccharide biosynthesis predicted glycosyltransferase SpsG/CMP-N-acetylneuraminic acid synthetase